MINSKSDIERPALRWHGGKWLLAPWIIEHFPAHRIYVEPFGGAASVLLQKKRCYGEVYNDLDGDVVNFFEVLRDSKKAEQLEAALRMTPFSRDEFNKAHRDEQDPIERARLIVVRSFMGFGSASSSRDYKTGFRSNSNRSGTTPAHDWRNYPDNVKALSSRLQGVTIENRDALQLMREHDTPETLHYVDPPYVHDTRHAGGKHCYRFEMTDENHEQLLAGLKDLSGFVVLSAYEHAIYNELESFGWTPKRRVAMADGARKRTEVLWLSPRCSDALTSLFNTA